MRRDAMRRAVVCASVLVAALLVTIAINASRWVGTTFPGFFVMANRVVPSIALPDWSEGSPSRLFQRQVLAVNGAPVRTAAEVYERVGRTPVGAAIDYTVRTPQGVTENVVVRSRQLGGGDFALLFGAYLLNGLAFAAIGLLVLLLKPASPASLGLFAFSMATGVFVITAADLYGPAWFFRLHVLAESLMAAGALHLALVFPTERIHRRRGAALLAVYAPFVGLAAVYETVLWSPAAYTAVHLVATTAQGLAAAVLIGAVAYDYLANRSALVRRRVRLVALGSLAGFLVPAVVLAASSLLGGSIALNWAAFTAFLFPLSVGYAIVQQDLFEIDVVLRRAVTYVVVVTAISLFYLTMLVVAGAAVAGLAPSSGSRLLFAVLNLAVLFAIAPLRARVQDAVDRLFFRRDYDAEQTLAALSRALSTACTLPDVTKAALRIVCEALWPRGAAVLVRRTDGAFASVAGSSLEVAGLALPQPLEARCERGEVLARYEWEDGTGRPLPSIWQSLPADLIVPIRHEGDSMALLVLGAKESGRAYNALDVTLLRTTASQVGLAMTTAEAFGQLAELNASLERQVRERTAELEEANGDLNSSVGELRGAYVQLERSQASLIRADRLATLGRLAAGIAHEINTPLGAVMNSLQTLVDLGREYADSIDDASVLSSDHREIAGEIVVAAENASAWAHRAAGFIRGMKLHGREHRSDVVEPFAIVTVVEEADTLLAHRLRASRCRVDFEESSPGVTVVGDSSRLGQVLVNLIANAIDAYEDRGIVDGRIVVRASAGAHGVTLGVEDRAGGIAPEHLPRIFEELFTTKEPGRGTGLGLCIARSLVEQSFAGTLTVETVAGVGSCFTVSLPRSDLSVARSSADDEPDGWRANDASRALEDEAAQPEARSSASLP